MPTISQLVKNERKKIVDKTKSLLDGAVNAPGFGSLNKKESYTREMLDYVADCLKIDVSKPWNKLKDEQRHALLWGTEGAKLHYGRDSFSFKNGGNDFVGIMGILENRYHFGMGNKEEMEKFMSEIYCNECEGNRLKPEALAVTVNGKNIAEVCDMQIEDIRKFFKDVKASMNEKELIIGERILKEIDNRLSFLINVGLSYLTLSRSAGSLSGGEAQRIRLATQIGSGLTGVLYVLDEPSIGLHQRDNNKLIESLKKLRDLDNTLIVVEHDEDTILNADYVVDIGPGAGVNGGKIVFSGTVDELKQDKKSITGKYISGEKKIDIPKERRKPKEECLEVIGAKQNNLKNIDVKFPLGVLTCVTGVSGSGKSSLVNEILYKSLARTLYKAKDKPGMCDKILGIENIDKVINIDQSPIGKTPRSNPATYTGLFDLIRDLFAMTPEAKTRGYQKGRFSFNVRGGRCESCQGDGIIKIEMHFLPDVYVPCEVCHGKRYNRETLEVKYKGKTISDVLDMTVAEGLEFFENIPKIKQILDTLNNVGLGYIKIGQPSTTLSGGESQRVKLATELSKRATGKTLYILDEPTTGLHFEDVRKLIDILQKLVDTGNSVLVIEHNLDVIKVSDYIIDIGPEAGRLGGEVVFKGTLSELMKDGKSLTAAYLRGMENPTAPDALSIAVPKRRRKWRNYVEITGASEHNLKNIDVDFPIGVFTCVTGVSGSGKSSLVNEILYKFLASKVNRVKCNPGKADDVVGWESINKIVNIDQSPIGRTPRSNPATYTKVFDEIRDLYSKLPEAKARGYTSGRFSFNVQGGRCEACGGDGMVKIEMHFLPDIYIPCDVCGGKRYNRETLEIKYKDKNIADVLELTVEEAVEFFEAIPL